MATKKKKKNLLTTTFANHFQLDNFSFKSEIFIRVKFYPHPPTHPSINKFLMAFASRTKQNSALFFSHAALKHFQIDNFQISNFKDLK